MKNRQRPKVASAGTLVVVGIVSALAALANPNGILLYHYPIRVLGHPIVRNFIYEWKSPSFQEWPGRWLLLYLALMGVGLVVKKQRPAFRDVVYVFFFGAATLVAQRNVVFLSIACSAPIALWLSSALDEGFSRLSAWRLWPRHKVFVDTRLEPFLKGALEESVCAVCCDHIGEWEKVFEKYNINFAMVNPTYPIASVLAGSTDWVRVYQDNRAFVFVRNVATNSAVIREAQYR